VVAHRETRDARADFLDDAGSLVAQDHRDLHVRPGAIGGVEAAMTDTARNHANQDFAVARIGKLDVFDAQWFALLVQYRGAHLILLETPVLAGAGQYSTARLEAWVGGEASYPSNRITS
jgi:hypothetical protein